MDHTVYPSAGLSQSRQHIPLHSDHLSNYPPLLPAPPQPQQHPQWQHQPQQHPQQQQQPSRQSTQQRMRVTDDTMASTSDFVKKLYKMLEDQSFQHVVAWGPQGDCFVVKDMNEFTKSILPRMFKHSNFASFVRQLNKYDFHKVKNTDDNQFGEHSWTFRHPDFHADRRDALENIKRKVPTQRKSLPNQRSTSPSGYGHMHSSPSSSQLEALQHQIERLTQAQEEMSAHVRSLERNYQDVLVEMVNFQRNMAQQDNLMQNLIQYFLQVENGKSKNRSSQEASAVLSQLNELARRTSSALSSDPFLSSLYPPTALAQNVSNSAGGSTLSASSSNLSPPPNPNTSSASGLSSSASSSASASTSRVWQQAATAGLINPAELGSGPSQLEKAMTRQEALSKIEQLKQTNRSVNEQSLANIYSMAAKGRDEAREALALNNWDVVSNPSLALGAGVEQQMAQQGLEVYTLGHLMPKEEQPQSSTASPDGGSPWGSFDPNGLGVGSLLTSQDGPSFDQKPQSSSSSQPSTPTYSTEAASSSSALVPSGGADASPQKLRVRRTTIVPAWAVPPRVLLVDDDAVSRKLSSKFLQVFGCTIDVAVDGVGAVNKMNIEKYDLVLMDIVMPKLDGVSATSMIRKFDHMTPIISMTSNSKPSQIMTYFSSGMNDILQKPFTKQGLLDMLEKHLMHLKVIQQMSQVPRSVGVPPLSDAGFEQALQTHAAAITASSTNASSSSLIPTQPTGDTNMDYLSMGGFGPDMDDGRVNPLASMGLTDDMYQAMLQNLIVTGQFPQAGGVDMSGVGDYSGSNKRPLDDAIDGREGKRSRFEVIE